MHLAEYVSKLGLELAGVATKQGRGGSRSPWQIATDASETRDATNVALWRDYCAGMKGARQLTWSKGIRERYGLRDKTDEEIAAEAEAKPDVVMLLEKEEWRVLRLEPSRKVAVLELSEKSGPEEVRALIARWMRERDSSDRNLPPGEGLRPSPDLRHLTRADEGKFRAEPQRSEASTGFAEVEHDGTEDITLFGRFSAGDDDRTQYGFVFIVGLFAFTEWSLLLRRCPSFLLCEGLLSTHRDDLFRSLPCEGFHHCP